MATIDTIPQPLILFDGVCNLCSGAVQFTIRHDPKGVLHFASLQSAVAAGLLQQYDHTGQRLSSIVLVEKGRLYTRSTAALRAARHLKGPLSLLSALIIIPPFIRDAVYDFIARHRYQWFGKKSECWLPNAELRRRFLE